MDYSETLVCYFFLGFFLTLPMAVRSAASDLTSAASPAKQIPRLVMISAGVMSPPFFS